VLQDFYLAGVGGGGVRAASNRVSIVDHFLSISEFKKRDVNKVDNGC
jgi:hypothetical protein